VSARTESESDARLPGTIHETADAIRPPVGGPWPYAPICPGLMIAAVWWRRRSRSWGRSTCSLTTPRWRGSCRSASSRRRFEVMFEVQVRAPFELAQLVLPGMRARGRGWILNISSQPSTTFVRNLLVAGECCKGL